MGKVFIFFCLLLSSTLVHSQSHQGLNHEDKILLNKIDQSLSHDPYVSAVRSIFTYGPFPSLGVEFKKHFKKYKFIDQNTSRDINTYYSKYRRPLFENTRLKKRKKTLVVYFPGLFSNYPSERFKHVAKELKGKHKSSVLILPNSFTGDFYNFTNVYPGSVRKDSRVYVALIQAFLRENQQYENLAFIGDSYGAFLSTAVLYHLPQSIPVRFSILTNPPIDILAAMENLDFGMSRTRKKYCSEKKLKQFVQIVFETIRKGKEPISRGIGLVTKLLKSAEVGFYQLSFNAGLNEFYKEINNNSNQVISRLEELHREEAYGNCQDYQAFISFDEYLNKIAPHLKIPARGNDRYLSGWVSKIKKRTPLYLFVNSKDKVSEPQLHNFRKQHPELIYTFKNGGHGSLIVHKNFYRIIESIFEKYL